MASTSTSAICCLVVLELDDEAPSIVAGTLKRTVPPAGDVLVDVVAVEVDLVGRVGVHGEIDRLALA